MDSWEDQANYLISYYQSLWERESDTKWLLGLYMAKRWLGYLRESPNMEEVALFVRVLEAERDNQGSGWSDLLFRVRNWIAIID
jgi:hypothetical protein